MAAGQQRDPQHSPIGQTRYMRELFPYYNLINQYFGEFWYICETRKRKVYK